MPTKTQLLNGINLACKYFVRSTAPELAANASTGAIEEDWTTFVPAQPKGGPIVCVVPVTGSITKGSPVTDEKGVAYTPVRLPDGLSAYKYFQPNNDHYAQILGTEITHDRNSRPKTTTAWVRFKFIDKEQDEYYQDVMEMEVRKITRWGPPLSAPELEYQAKVNRYGRDTTVPIPVPLPPPGSTPSPGPAVNFDNAGANRGLDMDGTNVLGWLRWRELMLYVALDGAAYKFFERSELQLGSGYCRREGVGE